MNLPKHATILVIEDDESVRRTLQDMLQLNGFTVMSATNGVEGFAAAKREAPAVILTDVEMPGMTGFELLHRLRADPDLRTLPVIVLSAKADRTAMRRGMELGAADFITKPFTEDEVIHSIAARLEKKELLDELDAFAHTVAHDLRNPLATLNGRLELANLVLGKADEATVRRHLEEAVKSSRRLNDIIDELLILAGVRRQAIVAVPLNLGACASEAVDRLEALLKMHEAVVRLPEAWPTAYGHAPWVIEVWANYISNAAKYGGAKPVITLGGRTNPDGQTARFWVQDTGLGLDAVAQTRMFVPFTRITAVRAKGHGLGLSIVRRIIEKLGGQVGVESSPGAGACFWFELPTQPPPSPPPDPGPPLLFA
jgi:signal transduction histidine kinase